MKSLNFFKRRKLDFGIKLVFGILLLLTNHYFKIEFLLYPGNKQRSASERVTYNVWLYDDPALREPAPRACSFINCSTCLKIKNSSHVKKFIKNLRICTKSWIRGEFLIFWGICIVDPLTGEKVIFWQKVWIPMNLLLKYKIYSITIYHSVRIFLIYLVLKSVQKIWSLLIAVLYLFLKRGNKIPRKFVYYFNDFYLKISVVLMK